MFMSAGYYGPARGCDEALNAYCERECTKDGALTVARLDGPGNKRKWRCYTLSALSLDTRKYVDASEDSSKYCTRAWRKRMFLSENVLTFSMVAFLQSQALDVLFV